jgi:hypothetical protein
VPDVRVAKSLSHFRCAERACSDADRWNPERLTMRPLRSPCDDFEIRARGICRSCGKTRELGPDELLVAADMDAFKELERRFRCSDCGERAVSVEPIWHKDWASAWTRSTPR